MSSEISSKSYVSSGKMKMPIFGLGTWQSTEQEIEIAINTAIDAGYRHFDTAFLYLNEAAIGRTLKKIIDSGKVKREDLFITTKLPRIANRKEYVETFIKKSLEALQLDYLDLYLIHNPVGLMYRDGNLFPKDANGEFELDYGTNLQELWKAMEEQVVAGRTKSIGVSNFNLNQVKRILEKCKIPPSNNQVELHIYLQQKELVSFCKENNVTVCAYAPLGSPALVEFTEKHGLSIDGVKCLSPLEDPVILEVARKHKKFPSQVLLRHLIQYGVAVIPKSTNPDRIMQNFDVFDFKLSEEEFQQISALDRGEEGRMFCGGGLFSGMKKHPEYPHSR